jgi:hypothetical protein
VGYAGYFVLYLIFNLLWYPRYHPKVCRCPHNNLRFPDRLRDFFNVHTITYVFQTVWETSLMSTLFNLLGSNTAILKNFPCPIAKIFLYAKLLSFARMNHRVFWYPHTHTHTYTQYSQWSCWGQSGGVPWRRLRVHEDCLPTCTLLKLLLFHVEKRTCFVLCGQARKLLQHVCILAQK